MKSIFRIVLSLSLLLSSNTPAFARGITVIPDPGTVAFYMKNMDAAITGIGCASMEASRKYVMMFIGKSWMTVYEGHPLFDAAMARVSAMQFIKSSTAVKNTLAFGRTVLHVGSRPIAAGSATMVAYSIIGIGVVYIGYQLGTIAYYTQVAQPKLQRRSFELSRQLGMSYQQIAEEQARLDANEAQYNTYWTHLKGIFFGL